MSLDTPIVLPAGASIYDVSVNLFGRVAVRYYDGAGNPHVAHGMARREPTPPKPSREAELLRAYALNIRELEQLLGCKAQWFRQFQLSGFEMGHSRLLDLLEQRMAKAGFREGFPVEHVAFNYEDTHVYRQEEPLGGIVAAVKALVEGRGWSSDNSPALGGPQA